MGGGRGGFASKVSLPKGKSQIKHILRKGEGHLIDTPANRKAVTSIGNNQKYYVGQDILNGNKWFSRINKDGSQTWVKVRGNSIANAGENKTPRLWDDLTGFDKNPFKK